MFPFNEYINIIYLSKHTRISITLEKSLKKLQSFNILHDEIMIESYK